VAERQNPSSYFHSKGIHHHHCHCHLLFIAVTIAATAAAIIILHYFEYDAHFTHSFSVEELRCVLNLRNLKLSNFFPKTHIPKLDAS
jgi:hypothetical protein